MKKKSAFQSAFLNPRILIGFTFCSIGVLFALIALALFPSRPVLALGSSPNATTAGQLIISEFRTRGLNGVNDEFIDLYNTTGSQLTTQSADGSPGLAIVAGDGIIRCIVPNGTAIPAGGHFLCVNAVAYSLSGYPSGSGSTATGNQTYTTDISEQAGIALFNNATGGASFSLANRLDAAGPTSEANPIYREGVGLPPLAPSNLDASWVRRLPGGCTGSGSGNCGTVALITDTAGPTSTQPQDTDDNAADFIFVDTNGTSAGGGQRLGAPAPQNLSGPGSLDGAANVATLDACSAETAAPNYVRDPTMDPPNNSTFGTVDLRKTFTNNSGNFITRLRFRVVDITTFPSISGVADLRPRNSTDVIVTVDRPPCSLGTNNVIVRGTILEQPPAQPNGGGYNSSLSVSGVSPGTPLAPGDSIDVRFLLGVQQNGVGRFCVASETVPASATEVSCFTPTDVTPGAIPTPTPCGVLFSENFDGVVPPALPAGWVSIFTSGDGDCNVGGPLCTLASHWVTDNTASDTAPNSAFHNDPSCVTDSSLNTPTFSVSSASAQLSFRNNFNTESSFDGCVLEVSSPNINGGAFTDITNPAVGGSFVTGGYTGTISTSFLSPIAGRQAWTGSSNGFITSTANLGPNVAGQDIKLRFRIASDCSQSGIGWRIDSLSVNDQGCAIAVNISTRMRVETGNNVLIGGFIITGHAPKYVALRGIGPSLSGVGVTDFLADPTLELRASNGTLIRQNNDWQDDPSQASQLSAIGLAPPDPKESAIAQVLQPNAAYTAILAGNGGGTGVGLVELYDFNNTVDAQLANISTRGFVLTDENVMIGGFILGGTGSTRVAVRGIGPSLAGTVSPVLADPTLELHNSNGATIAANDNWQDDPIQAAELMNVGLAPQDPNESGLFQSLPVGAFTAILSGKDGGTGIGLVEVYNVH